MSKVITIVLLLLAFATVAQDSAKDEAQVWQLEKAYWEYAVGRFELVRFCPL